MNHKTQMETRQETPKCPAFSPCLSWHKMEDINHLQVQILRTDKNIKC